jgi:5'-deoxynucleotidase YfbR-like HD superfamily hydrolase
MPEESTRVHQWAYMSQQKLDLNDLKPDQICIKDIAHNLSMLPRFCGNTRRPYTVLEHSLMVFQMVEAFTSDPNLLLQALLHDATEAYIGDIPAPVKNAVPAIREFETTKIWPAIADRFGIEHELDPMIKQADWAAFYAEALALCECEDMTQWERYDEFYPIAAAWIEECGEIDKDVMPHPQLTQDVFLNVFAALIAARREAAA